MAPATPYSSLPSRPPSRAGLAAPAADFFYSGVFDWYGVKIGYIRIPNYSPPSQATALRQFDTEIAYMNDNTAGLVIDEMRNTGGNLCFGEAIATRLIPYQFQVTGFEVRPFWSRILGFYNAWINAKSYDAPREIIQQYELIYNEMLSANRYEGRLVTQPLPFALPVSRGSPPQPFTSSRSWS